MTESAEDILNRKRGEGTMNISEFVGQTLTIVEFDEAQGTFGDYVNVTALNEAGEEVMFQTGVAAIVGKLKGLQEGKFLPRDVVVVSGPSRFGPAKPWYNIMPVREGE